MGKRIEGEKTKGRRLRTDPGGTPQEGRRGFVVGQDNKGRVRRESIQDKEGRVEAGLIRAFTEEEKGEEKFL